MNQNADSLAVTLPAVTLAALAAAAPSARTGTAAGQTPTIGSAS